MNNNTILIIILTSFIFLGFSSFMMGIEYLKDRNINGFFTRENIIFGIDKRKCFEHLVELSRGHTIMLMGFYNTEETTIDENYITLYLAIVLLLGLILYVYYRN